MSDSRPSLRSVIAAIPGPYVLASEYRHALREASSDDPDFQAYCRAASFLSLELSSLAPRWAFGRPVLGPRDIYMTTVTAGPCFPVGKPMELWWENP